VYPSVEFCAAKLQSQTAQRFETPSGEGKMPCIQAWSFAQQNSNLKPRSGLRPLRGNGRCRLLTLPSRLKQSAEFCAAKLQFFSLTFLHLSYLSLLHPLPLSSIVVADRAPSCGGIAPSTNSQCTGTPAGSAKHYQHSRRKRVLCLPSVDVQQEYDSTTDEYGMQTRRVCARRRRTPKGLRPPQGNSEGFAPPAGQAQPPQEGALPASR
jgi:hypothetical protein